MTLGRGPSPGLDELAKAVAEKRSRRHVIKLGLAALFAGVTASVAPAWLRPGWLSPASGDDTPLCPDRVPKPNHRPSVSDPPCGPESLSGTIGKIIPQTWGDAKFYIGCTRHDICYDTCNTKKEDCDREFLELMTAECRRAYPPGAQLDPDPHGYFYQRTYNMCVRVARMYQTAVAKTSVGAGAYKSAQMSACECCKEHETKCGQEGHEVCCKACETCQGDQCKPKCPDLCAPCDETTGECKQKDCPLCTECLDGNCVPKKCQTCEECFLDECVSTCPPEQECCHDQCVDPTCPPGETFNSSTCQCQCATQMCEGVCCPPGQICCNGQCKPQSQCGTRVHCACNGQTYDDVQTCLAECHVSLGCFTGICTPVN